MSYGIGGGGIVGVALETVANTYVAPTKFVPINSESLGYKQATTWRRPIRNSVDTAGPVPGNVNIEGDMTPEALEDVIPYFLMVSRLNVVKTGAGPNYIYTATPTANATPAKTLSITVVRNGIVFGYVGCVVSSYRFGVQDGMLTYSCSLIGSDETVQSAPTPTWPTTAPFGAGTWTIEVPTSTPVTDTDTFEVQVEDNAEPQFRLKSTGRGAVFMKYGERNATMTVEKDFQNRTEYDAFKAYTAQSITLKASKGANNEVSLVLPAAVKNTYAINLGSQGDLVRGSVEYQLALDGTGVPFTIVCKTQENIA